MSDRIGSGFSTAGASPPPVPIVTKNLPKTAIVQPALVVDRPLPHAAYDVAKRIIDLTMSIALLAITSPIWITVAAAIKLTSEGPVLFQGTVIGKDCKPFTYYKFRSMDADSSDDDHREFIHNYVKYNRPHTTIEENGRENGVYKLINDSRVTPVGKIIRRLSIDELPQLINVVQGEMSLVGPRPPVLHEYELYDDWAKQRLTVLPGITGLYQVSARNAVPFDEMVELDLEYISRRSIWLDLWVMLRTPLAMLRGR